MHSHSRSRAVIREDEHKGNNGLLQGNSLRQRYHAINSPYFPNFHNNCRNIFFHIFIELSGVLNWEDYCALWNHYIPGNLSSNNWCWWSHSYLEIFPLCFYVFILLILHLLSSLWLFLTIPKWFFLLFLLLFPQFELQSIDYFHQYIPRLYLSLHLEIASATSYVQNRTPLPPA